MVSLWKIRPTSLKVNSGSLATHVHGWGRVHLVERLESTNNAEIKEWLLRDGYKNSVMYEYLAYPCATTGGLLHALTNGGDDGLLNAAERLHLCVHCRLSRPEHR